MRITATNEELRNEVLARYVAATSGDAGAEVAREFDAWLAADPRRRQVAEALRLPEDDTRALRVLFADEIRTLRRRRVRRRGAWLGVACAVAAAIAVIVGGHHTREVPPGMAETITLADGSTMILSGGGAAEIPFAPWARRVRLVRGEALFTVVHHDDIPFAVECGTAEVVDVGTRFVVHADATGPSVAVFEGVVHLNAGSSGSQFLKAGQAAAVLPSGIVPQPAENEADATAWRTGVVVFHNTPLSVAAHRLATAWGRPVTITQPALADLRVSGRFRLEDQAGLLRALSLALPISVRYGASGIDFLPR